MVTMQEMLATMPQIGRVRWLGIRTAARMPVDVVSQMEIDIANAVVGDHYAGKPESKRQVTLIQQEHIDAMAGIMEMEIDPGQLRRNIVVSGINLQALKEQHFRVGTVLLFGTSNCHPCSRMEENLGPGGYNAMRGHGGITARVVESGIVRIGDRVELEIPLSEA